MTMTMMDCRAKIHAGSADGPFWIETSVGFIKGNYPTFGPEGPKHHQKRKE
ncbi:uncharacterized protein ACLA_073410 [Aspergillus clavatus NRRL 1]|uniref:Uncharacterized protein n=1 Tax=Aspergillus clavatus (strain ATCC 1007 / CBS 513.65 / DSM 816 / NCTC 3887 / NRRL 1 / QM 1276 / 107) TaxID=344612 RepID=A1C7D5_ASPCL|nr:uncharacterized protein ACLA_073410 [Aspergillus clavatus NRRL 1]EAW14306.1 hypothetical protein ACLA_073410 [Aspergillus clavatus NRRL 1]